jgi:predicted DCC family thiol-disulfide oxidoreductase YuxK
MQQTHASAAPELTLYYDGKCPLCVAEVEFLQSRNAQGQLAFVDVTQTGFEAAGHNISCEAAMAQIHGRTADGQVLVGVPVFATAYKLAKLPVLAWVLSRRWLMPVLQPAYVLFAKHRQAISQRI